MKLGTAMTKLTDFVSYADAQRVFTVEKLWELFDGTRESLNMAHECVDRHAGPGRIAVRLAHADGTDEEISYTELARLSARFAHWLVAQGVAKGERVAIMLPASLGFYVCLYGAMKAGAVAVPLFTLFGSEALRMRVEDCGPRVLLVTKEKESTAHELQGVDVVVVDEAFLAALAQYPAELECRTSSSDMAIYQYTSGTSTGLPTAVKHTHRSITLMMSAALYGTGIRPGDTMFCPSSVAWGHGLWHGVLAPMAIGMSTGTMPGKFDPDRMCEAIQDHGANVVSAAPTHYRMIRTAGVARKYQYHVNKVSFTGEPMDTATQAFIQETFGVPACSIYGTTEVGTILACYPGAPDFVVKPDMLGKPTPGLQVRIQDSSGTPCKPGELGEIVVLRRGQWLPTKDLGHVDENGYFFYGGRADDVIISAGWTMSAIEIENILLMHPEVLEAAVIAVPDSTRGHIAKAFIVSGRNGSDAFAAELQEFTKTKLSLHEYPRAVAFVTQLPKTPAGKVNRRQLRLDEQRRSQEASCS